MKGREFWIAKAGNRVFTELEYMNGVIANESNADYFRNETDHVIKYSAYEALEEKFKASERQVSQQDAIVAIAYSNVRLMQDKLKVAVAALEVIGDVGHPNPVGLARNTVTKIKGGANG